MAKKKNKALTGEKKSGDKHYTDPYSGEKLLSPDEQKAVFERLSAEQKEQELIAAGWIKASELTEKIGLKQRTILFRTKKINPQEEYSFTQVLTGKIITKKGSGWVWKNPNNEHADIFIHPDLAEIWRQEIEKEKQLKEQGWKTKEETVAYTGLAKRTVKNRITAIDPDGKYSFKNPLTDTTVTKKGVDWTYKNPNNKNATRFIHPDLAEIWRQEAEKEKQLEDQGWKTTVKAAEETGLAKKTIQAHLKRINPEEEYSFKEPLTGNTITKKGTGWVYQNPNNKKAEYFIHPTLVKIWRQEAEIKARKKSAKGTKGATSQKIGALDEEKAPEVADEAAQKKKGRGHGK